MELLVQVALLRTLVLRELLVFHLLARWHAQPRSQGFSLHEREKPREQGCP